MTPAEILALRYPWFAAETDPRFVAEPTRDAILLLAANYRPSCLPTAVQDIAQAHYAAHMLLDLAAAGSTSDRGQTSGVLVREREHEVERQWALPSQVGGQIVSTGSGQTPYAAWKALNDLCRATSADGTPLVPPVRRGAIITRYG